MNAILSRTQVKPQHFIPQDTPVYPASVQRVSMLNVARARLSSFVMRMANDITRSTGINYEENDAAPETWLEAKAMFQSALTLNKPVYVRKSDSDMTIYTSPAANWAFRFWHDYVHFKHDLSHSFIDEILVSNFQVEAVEREFGVGSLEAKLMAADTYGQVMYFRVHGTFIADQLAFAKSYIQEH